MEDTRREHRVGLAVDDALGEVLERAHAARRDHGDVDGARHCASQRDVEAVLGAVAIHAREQDLARPAPRGLLGP